MKRKKLPKRKAQLKSQFADWFIPFLCFVIIMLLAAPFLLTGWHTDQIPFDWDAMFTGAEITRRAWANATPYFSWIPWFCGGFPSAEYAFYKLFSPSTFLELFFGVVPGGKLSYVLWQCVGAWGTVRVVKRLVPKADHITLLAAGLAFGLQGFFLNHLRVGHFGFEFFNAFPWLIEGFLVRSVMQVAFVMSYSLISLAVDFAAHLAVYAIACGMILLVYDWREIRFLLKSAFSVLGMSAVILVTQGGKVSTMEVIHKELSQTPLSLYRLMTTWKTELWECDVDCYFEYGAYVGHLFFILGVIGIFYTIWKYRNKREHQLWVSCAIIAFSIALGPLWSWSPWSLIVHIPVLRNLQVNTRFLGEFTLFLTIGWAFIISLIHTKWSRWALTAASVFPILAFAAVSYQFPGHGPLLPEMTGLEKAQPIQMESFDARTSSYLGLSRSVASQTCYVAYPFEISPSLKVGQGMLLSGPDGSRLSWNGFAWILTQSQAIEVGEWVLNQNFHPKLKASLSTDGEIAVFNANGNLGVRANHISAGSVITIKIEATPLESLSIIVTVASWLAFLYFLTIKFRQKTKLNS